VGRKRKILAVVKANAYGLGAIPIAKILAKAGTEWFGVTCTNEGVALRESGIRQSILVLTGFWQGEEKQLLRNSLTPTVTNLEQLKWLERAAARPAWRGKRARVPFHVKINTGMNRLLPRRSPLARIWNCKAPTPISRPPTILPASRRPARNVASRKR
jgi:alanine racemase